MSTFNVEVVLKGRDFAVTEKVSIPYPNPAEWTDMAVQDVLTEMLRAISRADNPKTPVDRPVVLQGFSWIVEPASGGVVIAIEIPMGAAVAGPFDVKQADLDAMITRVVHSARQSGPRPSTIH